MFTGIVEHVGTVESVELSDVGARYDFGSARSDQIGATIRVNAGPLILGLEKSGSIAVNGCCLTAIDISAATFSADLSGETLRRTSLGHMKPGMRVNLERPLTAMKELGGHFVQGHVDGAGRVTRLEPEGANWWFGVEIPTDLARYIAMKGSISLDGISLTVADWHDGIVETAIIPYTYEHTNLSFLKVGDAVNVECDILAKHVDRILEGRQETPKSVLNIAKLMEQGF
jgi:riboflavin synthase